MRRRIGALDRGCSTRETSSHGRPERVHRCVTPIPPGGLDANLSLGALLRRAGRSFLKPVPDAVRDAVERRRQALPESIRSPEQIIGRTSPGCAATWGIFERCNYSCTACYLSDDANRARPLPFEAVRAQLDAIRADLGPGGNTQITSGEVALLPVEDLVRILRYCREIDLAPMVMTNGQVFLDDAKYLERLVVEGGLDKIAVHVDSTQRGRPGWRAGISERELLPAREASARLIREVRQRTGRPLHAAHTVTVTEQNLHEIPEVVRWTVENADAFRMLSLQPVARIGRTTTNGAKPMREEVWQNVCDGLGSNANRSGWRFGHPECNDVAVLLLVAAGSQRRVIESVRADSAFDRWFLRSALNGSMGGFRPDDGPSPVVLANLMGRLVRDPRMLVQGPIYAAYRVWTERGSLAALAGALVRGRRVSVRPFVVVVHHFMQTDELETPKGRERLAACAFRVPIDGRMVSMCEVNASGMRKELTRRLKAGPRESVR